MDRILDTTRFTERLNYMIDIKTTALKYEVSSKLHILRAQLDQKFNKLGVGVRS